MHRFGVLVWVKRGVLFARAAPSPWSLCVPDLRFPPCASVAAHPVRTSAPGVAQVDVHREHLLLEHLAGIDVGLFDGVGVRARAFVGASRVDFCGGAAAFVQAVAPSRGATIPRIALSREKMGLGGDLLTWVIERKRGARQFADKARAGAELCRAICKMSCSISNGVQPSCHSLHAEEGMDATR
ncbi:uncharacterized protein CC84DRAFT_1181302 [Paraphaeosphaeria sporulosa]|uniref:Uncharacterized protein n=1 Tax=Paraphaeosphaeria sporulosa TaxID=1460663 RepID=A0A177BZ84_9PLEO|nr:uncharacterized protein CC84DRAFT_1181302 [Paraphaeosphaeria sporulosa]OAF99847.1 hypothetical protein CC84DRAFT_1181302 [Paraphaeosphaeria sporulosa]